MKRPAKWAVSFSLLFASGIVGQAQQRKNAKRPIPPPKTEAQETSPPSSLTEAIRANNLGIALMDRQQFGDALGKFQTACILGAQSDVGCLNAGIALLNMQQYEPARTILAKSAERDPQNPHAWFNLALLEKIGGSPDAALEDFKKVAAIDPQDADTEYLIGLTYSEEGQDDQAVEAFQSTEKLDPFLASAEMGLAKALERANDTDGALTHLDRFRHLIAENLGRSVSSTYGKQGRYSLAQEWEPDPGPVPDEIPVHFVDVTTAAGLSPHLVMLTARGRVNAAHRGASAQDLSPGGISRDSHSATIGEKPSSLADFLGSGACVFDFDGDGRPDIFLVNADGKGNAALYRNLGHGQFTDVTRASNIHFHGQGTGCAAGDYDNDGRVDLAISSSDGVMLLHNEGNGKFRDATQGSGIQVSGLSMGLQFIDTARDGRLDLYVTRFPDFPVGDPRQPFAFPDDAMPPGNMLWHNKGNGTFEDRTKEAGVMGSAASAGILETDINNDGTIDFILTGWRKSPEVILNSREGPFQTMPWGAEMPGVTAGGVALDFDKSGWMDFAFSHWAQPCLSLWRNVKGQSFEQVPLPDPGWMRAWGIAALDYDNDGWIDLVAVGETFGGEGRIVLLRNEGGKGFEDVTSETGLDKIQLHDPRSVIAFDYNGDGTADLLITQNHLPPVLLKNAGANKNGWIELALNGSMGNRAGIGSQVRLFSGAQQQKWEISGASGYLSQGPPEILAGLGGEYSADVIRIAWPTGVTQEEMQVRGGNRKVINEVDRDARQGP